MSLKAFHILFILIAILLAAGCAAWSYFTQSMPGFGMASGVIAVALVVYGGFFIKKSRKIIV